MSKISSTCKPFCAAHGERWLVRISQCCVFLTPVFGGYEAIFNCLATGELLYLRKILYLRCWSLLTRLLLAHTYRLLLAHTYQAILVLLPKLTNAPTKVHTGCIVLWGSGVCLYTCYFCCHLFFCIMLIVMPLLQLTYHDTYISLQYL